MAEETAEIIKETGVLNVMRGILAASKDLAAADTTKDILAAVVEIIVAETIKGMAVDTIKVLGVGETGADITARPEAFLTRTSELEPNLP